MGLLLVLGMGALVVAATLPASGVAGRHRPASASHPQALAQAEHALTQALAALGADTRTLTVQSRFNELLAQYGEDWSAMQADYVRDLTDLRAGCASSGQAKVDAQLLAADLATMQSDDATLLTEQGVVSTGIARAQADQDAVQAAWQRLQAVLTAAPGARATTGFSSQDVNAALYRATQQITLSRMAAARAQAAAGVVDQEASNLSAAARHLNIGQSC